VLKPRILGNPQVKKEFEEKKGAALIQYNVWSPTFVEFLLELYGRKNRIVITLDYESRIRMLAREYYDLR